MQIEDNNLYAKNWKYLGRAGIHREVQTLKNGDLLKTFIITLLSILAFSDIAIAKQTETKVRHPIVVDDNLNSHISVINQALKTYERFPEYFEVSELESDEAAYTRWVDLQKRFSQVMLKKGKDYQDLSIGLGVIPTAFDSEQFKTCYVGSPKAAVSVAQKLVSYEFTEQLTVWAWRFGKTDHMVDGDDSPVQESEAWNKYDTTRDTVLMLASFNDSGDDLNEIVIKRCSN